MSYKKIARWFNNKTFSRPYFDSLKRVKDIPLLSQDRKQATDNHSGAERDVRDEFDSDRRFLETILKPYKECPTELGTMIEHLLKKVDESLTVSGNIELYTNDTRTEFHDLLLVLFHRFEHILNLQVPSKNSSDSGPELLPDTKYSYSGPEWLFSHKRAVEQLRYYSYALLMLAKGRAFRMHLENIEHLLNDPPHTSAGVSTHKHEQGQEEDFDGVLPPQKLQSYIA